MRPCEDRTKEGRVGHRREGSGSTVGILTVGVASVSGMSAHKASDWGETGNDAGGRKESDLLLDRGPKRTEREGACYSACARLEREDGLGDEDASIVRFLFPVHPRIRRIAAVSRGLTSGVATVFPHSASEVDSV